MYSVVLLMALTNGAETPALGRGCQGCYGCYGCYGGHGCHGCYGCKGGRGGLFGRRGGCHGCYGGYGCHGCYGGYGCHGCYGGYGGHGCYGGYGCHGCYGGYGGHGCYGGYGCHGGVVVPHHGAPIGVPAGPGGPAGPAGPAGPGGPAGPDGGAPKDLPRNGGDKEGAPAKIGAVDTNSATIVVTLPADARLKVDGHATSSTSSTRILSTPALPPGQEFHYELTAEVVRDGQTLSATKRVAVRAGEETRVQLDFPVANVASR